MEEKLHFGQRNSFDPISNGLASVSYNHDVIVPLPKEDSPTFFFDKEFLSRWDYVKCKNSNRISS